MPGIFLFRDLSNFCTPRQTPCNFQFFWGPLPKNVVWNLSIKEGMGVGYVIVMKGSMDRNFLPPSLNEGKPPHVGWAKPGSPASIKINKIWTCHRKMQCNENFSRSNIFCFVQDRHRFEIWAVWCFQYYSGHRLCIRQEI